MLRAITTEPAKERSTRPFGPWVAAKLATAPSPVKKHTLARAYAGGSVRSDMTAAWRRRGDEVAAADGVKN